ncbi:hypothetical protein BDP27DRAFT_1358783 [Rhodocollybia butyracea]|uniref:Uncharacterized protein n=1 Tax=Rhodocollybia butyracea TaxID=206335 RepID=A0A9P5UET1_9AGAR|nr:hypothetical protein BDP27DRAFT_1358783 [Rhodocollybia butyracea]
MSTNNSKYDWKQITLTPIKENPDRTNNFAKFKHKTTIKLKAHGLWKVQGLDTSGNAVDITLQGNEPAVALEKQIHNDWLETDKHVLSLINDAVPIQKTWVIQKCKSSHDAWNSLCKEFEPNNSLTAMNLNQQISMFSCQPGANPAVWLEIMLQLYGRLCQADPTLMSDFEFLKMLITHMCKDEAWRYCQSELRVKLVTAQEMGCPLSSSIVVSRLKLEEIHHGVAPSIKSIQNLVQSASLYPSGSAVPSLHLAQTSVKMSMSLGQVVPGSVA